MARKRMGPELPGLVVSSVFEGAWLQRQGKTWSYFLPSDSRPTAKRVTVHIWTDGKESYVKCIEGDGRSSDFKTFEVRTLPDDATDDVAATVAQEMASKYLLSASLAELAEDASEKLTASLLTEAGFRLDDFYGQQAWLLGHSVEGMTYFIRGEPDVVSFNNKGTLDAVKINDSIKPDMPCEVGIVCDQNHNTVSTVAPTLEDAIRVIEDGKLPLPSIMENWTFDYNDLYPTQKPR